LSVAFSKMLQFKEQRFSVMDSDLSKKWPIGLIIITALGAMLMSGCSGTSEAGTTGAAAPTTVIGVRTIPPAVTSTPATTTSTGATATVGDTVKVDYTGRLADGTVFDSSVGKTPLEFTLGDGEVIKGFELAVLGMSIGQSKTVVIPPQDAYGAHLDNLVTTVSRSQMGPGLNPTVGQHLTVTHSDGTTGSVVVTAVTDSTVTVDANHPLAGKALTFDITLLSIAPKK
jgi:peptidylprolyl isomerase